MNNTFSLSRFLRLFSKYSREHFKNYMMSVFVLIGILSIVMGFIAYGNNGLFPVKLQLALFFGFLTLSGTIFTSLIFAELGNQKQAIPALLLPVSPLERFLVAWIYSFLIFQVVYVISFYAVDSVVVYLGNSNPKAHNTLLEFDEANKTVVGNYLGYVLFHSICFLGAISYNKMHFVKTGFAFFIAIVMITFLNYGIVHTIFSNVAHLSAPFAGLTLKENNQYYYLRQTQTGTDILMYLVLALTALFWTTTYFKLKEKQV